MTTAPSFTLKGWHFAAIMASFFAIVIGVDVFMSVLAYRTFPGEVSDQPFEEGVAYNKTLAQQARQEASGLTATADATDEAAGRRRVSIVIADRAGAPVRGLTVTADLIRPMTNAGRTNLTLHEVGPGLYRADGPALAGVWDLVFVAKLGQDPLYKAQRRFTWP